jgi:hypothetical protein
MKDAIIELYKRAQKEVEQPITLLNISENELCLLSVSEGKLQEWTIMIGPKQVSVHFRHHPPTPSELEYAINDVEDAVVPLSKKIPDGTQLVSFNQNLYDLAKVWDNTIKRPCRMTTDNVESIFTRWGFIVSGRPSSTDSLPEDPVFAAYLLLLREVLHHLKFNSIIILS